MLKSAKTGSPGVLRDRLGQLGQDCCAGGECVRTTVPMVSGLKQEADALHPGWMSLAANVFLGPDFLRRSPTLLPWGHAWGPAVPDEVCTTQKTVPPSPGPRGHAILSAGQSRYCWQRCPQPRGSHRPSALRVTLLLLQGHVLSQPDVAQLQVLSFPFKKQTQLHTKHHVKTLGRLQNSLPLPPRGSSSDCVLQVAPMTLESFSSHFSNVPGTLAAPIPTACAHSLPSRTSPPDIFTAAQTYLSTQLSRDSQSLQAPQLVKNPPNIPRV